MTNISTHQKEIVLAKSELILFLKMIFVNKKPFLQQYLSSSHFKKYLKYRDYFNQNKYTIHFTY